MADNAATMRARVRAFAKLNLMLRVLGVRDDGYHELRTTFQSLALHDTITITPAPRGAFAIECSDPTCPTDESNLIWRAADRLWHECGRRPVRPGVHVRLVKRIPSQAGLGGGSSDAAAALRALAAFWHLRVTEAELRAIGGELGADVPFFFEGGTVLGLERGDLLFPLLDRAASWVVVARPAFGVSTRDAFAWWDENRTHAGESGNDLEPVVVSHHPVIGELIGALRRAGGTGAAMSGSGSAVFALFDRETTAQKAARHVGVEGVSALVTRTLTRAAYQRGARPQAGQV